MPNDQNISIPFGFNVTLIDNLIKKFKDWDFKPSESGSIKEFHWPEIILSDKLINFRDPITKENSKNEESSKDTNGIIELMGCYNIISNNLQEEEGVVILYYERINIVTNHYLEHLRISSSNSEYNKILKKNFESFMCIILLHELVHWIMRWVEFPINKKFISSESVFADEVFFHEGFAQFFTWQMIKDIPQLKLPFLWLETKQPIQYKMYKELTKIQPSPIYQKNKDLTEVEENLDLISIDDGIRILEFSRRFQTQSFELATFTINLLKRFEEFYDLDSSGKVSSFKNCNKMMEEWLGSNLTSKQYADNNKGRIASKKFNF